MNKTELASSVATRTSITRATADSAVATVFATIAEALARGEKVSIAGFGISATRSRPARQSRNPATGESIAIAACTSPSLKAGKTLRDAANRQSGRSPRTVDQLATGPCIPNLRCPNRCLWQRREMGQSSNRHSSDHMRNRAQSLNPLARSFLVSPDGNFPRRHRCARVRASNTGSVAVALTPVFVQHPDGHVRSPRTKSRRHGFVDHRVSEHHSS